MTVGKEQPMIYLFTALYEEARIFIERYHMKKTAEETRFLHFYSETEGLRLTVTGVGEIAAAVAVSHICTKYPPGEGDFLLNIGICAGQKEGCFLIHKLTEQATGKTFYPDLLYRHPFLEESLVTGMTLLDVQQERERCLGETLYDMEAAAVYQAGKHFFGPHQMLFLKIVSDFGEPGNVSGKRILTVMRQEAVFDFIEQLCALKTVSRRDETAAGKPFLQQDAVVERLCADLHCSKTMEASLRQHIRYLALAGADYEAVIQKMYEEKLLP